MKKISLNHESLTRVHLCALYGDYGAPDGAFMLDEEDIRAVDPQYGFILLSNKEIGVLYDKGTAEYLLSRGLKRLKVTLEIDPGREGLWRTLFGRVPRDPYLSILFTEEEIYALSRWKGIFFSEVKKENVSPLGLAYRVALFGPLHSLFDDEEVRDDHLMVPKKAIEVVRNAKLPTRDRKFLLDQWKRVVRFLKDTGHTVEELPGLLKEIKTWIVRDMLDVPATVPEEVISEVSEFAWHREMNPQKASKTLRGITGAPGPKALPEIKIDRGEYKVETVRDGRCLTFGFYTSCCQQLSGAAADTALATYVDPRYSLYAVTYKGRIVAGTAAWVNPHNSDEVVFDNIEAISSFAGNGEVLELFHQLVKELTKAGYTVYQGTGSSDIILPGERRGGMVPPAATYTDADEETILISV